ncbi:MAG: hypothetical protein ABI597_06595 [Gammaproteobacteria bacterium]
MPDQDDEKNQSLTEVARQRREQKKDEDYRMTLDEEIRRKNIARKESDEYIKKQITQTQEVNVQVKWFFRLGSVITNAIKVAGDAIGIVGKIIPPLNALITGMFTIVDLVEAIFISQETRQRRGVKIFTSIMGSGLTIAAAVLTFNPLTAPLGAALSAGAMFVATIKEAYFWYNAKIDLDNAKKNLVVSSEELANFTTSHPTDKAGINKLKNTISVHKAAVYKARITRNEKRRAFAYNALSFVGMTLLAVTAFALAGAILANPIGLGIAGVSLLAVAVVGGAYNTYKKRKSAKAGMPQSIEPSNQLANENKQDVDHSLSHHNEHGMANIIGSLAEGKVETHALSGDNLKKAKKLAKNVVAALAAENVDDNKQKKNVVTPVAAVNNHKDEKSDDDDEGEKFKFHE